MRVLFLVGLLCLLLLFVSRLGAAISARFIDIFLAAELGLLLALFVLTKSYDSAPLRIVFVTLSLLNIFYFVYSGYVNPLGGLLYSVIHAVFHALLFGLPILWVCKHGKR